jgi:uncharacterized protein (DUF488 family)
MTTSTPTLFTIGHSNHQADAFIQLLRRHAITALVDVRSSPYSRFSPQFNREPLAESLRHSGIRYVFLGAELGARRTEREAYDGPVAAYRLIASLPAFRAGLDRVREGIRGHRIALMCAEKDPLTCHRSILVCRALRDDGLSIAHILESGELETMAQAEERLFALTGIHPDDFFRTREDLLAEAYERQAARIAYAESTSATEQGATRP